MPLKKCSSNNRSGWKWGDKGHCYTGKDAKKKAIRQGYAIDPKHFKEEITKSNISKKEILDILNNEKDLIPNEIEALMLAADLSVAEVMAVFEERTKFLDK